MTTLTCTKRYRNKSRVTIGFQLVNNSGVAQDFEYNYVRSAMDTGTIEITNLTLSADNKIIASGNCAPPTDVYVENLDIKTTKKVDLQLTKQFINKIDCEKVLTFLSRQDLDVVTRKCESSHYQYQTLTEGIMLIDSPHNRIVAATGLIELTEPKDDEVESGIFAETGFREIDLSDVYIHKISKLDNLFAFSRVKSVVLPRFNDSEYPASINSFTSMFQACQLEHLELDSLKPSGHNANYKSMFQSCKIKELDLSELSWWGIEDCSAMFTDCTIETLKLGAVGSNKLKNLMYMFDSARIKDLQIGSITTAGHACASGMFYGAHIGVIDLSGFDTSGLELMNNMFTDCVTRELKLQRFKVGKSSDKRYELLRRNRDANIAEIFDGCKCKIYLNDPKLIEAYKNRNKDHYETDPDGSFVSDDFDEKSM